MHRVNSFLFILCIFIAFNCERSIKPHSNLDCALNKKEGAENSRGFELIVKEAELYDRSYIRKGYHWRRVTGRPGFTGRYYLRAVDTTNDIDTPVHISYANRFTSPQVSYEFYLKQSNKKYYVWMRGFGMRSIENSCYWGLGDGLEDQWNNEIQTDEWKQKKWIWVNQAYPPGPDNGRASFIIRKSGWYTLNFWMKERGFRLDKFVITNNPSYKPFPKVTIDTLSDSTNTDRLVCTAHVIDGSGAYRYRWSSNNITIIKNLVDHVVIERPTKAEEQILTVAIFDTSYKPNWKAHTKMAF